MRQRVQEMVELLRRSGHDPAAIQHRDDGRTTIVWYGDDGDRYAEVTDSLSSGDFLCLVRDHRNVAVVVIAEVGEVVCWVRAVLDGLARSHTPIAVLAGDQHVVGGG